ncbi:MAG: metal-dependent hydrolase [Acidimicrobiales bacterium]
MIVWLVFRSPAIDYRLVMLGSVLPLVDAVARGLWALHSLTFSALLLLGVAVVTRGRRLTQRRWVALPVGVFLHLVLDGMWARTEGFWWPFTGWGFDGRLPEAERGLLALAMEVVGAVALVWWWRRFGLADAGRRRRFLRTGQLDRGLAGPSAPAARS